MKVIWGNDIDDLNTVGCTIRCCSFFSMQMIRLFMLILLFGSWMIYSYVYMRSVLFFYNWWASTFTLMAFTLLFIGSGKQVVFQKLVELKMIEFGDPKKKSNIWLKGVFYYSQAIPFVVVSNIIYWINMRAISNNNQIEVGEL